jgi:hypothetical protein
VVNTATARQAHSALGVATRLHGADSPEALKARRAYRTVRLSSQIRAVRDELGEWTAAERVALLAALDGHEVSLNE